MVNFVPLSAHSCVIRTLCIHVRPCAPPSPPYRPDLAGMLVRPSAKLLSLMAVQGSASQIGSASQLVNVANERWACMRAV